MKKPRKLKIRKSIIFIVIAILLVAIGFFNRKYFSHEIAKQDHMAPVYGEGSLEGWAIQFDMYTNNPGENAVDKTNSVSSIDHEFQSKDEYKYITLQTSYTYTGQDSFEPNTIKIYIPKYIIGWGNNSKYELYQTTMNVAAGPVEEGYEWNYTTETIDNNEYYVFTNNKQLAVEEGKENLEGMFQIAYAIKGEEIYIRYDSTTQQEISLHKEFNARFVNTVDDNSIISDTKEVTLNYPKANYTITKKAEKIKSLDGLPSADYIWVHYTISSSKTNETENLRSVFKNTPSNEASEFLLIKETLPSENCVILDNEMNEILSETNDYYVEADLENKNPHWSFYIGYPLSEFEDETITNTAKFYGQYRDVEFDYYHYNFEDNLYTHEIEYIAEDSIEINLNDFEFSYPEGNYGIIKHVNKADTIGQKLNDSLVLSFKKIKESNDEYSFYVRPITTYTGIPLTVRIGDDREYIESSDGLQKEWLNDNDYFFSYIKMPILKNGNGTNIKTYQAKLYVRYAGSNDYVLYSNSSDANAGIFNTGSEKTFEFTETNIVGWYIEIYNMKESIASKVSLTTKVKYSKEDIGEIGTAGNIYNFAYFDVYDGQGNLLNGADESSYTGTGYNDGLAQWDYETYGHYPRRDYAYAKYTMDKEGYWMTKSISNRQYQLDRWIGEVELDPKKLSSYGYSLEGPITKIDMYDLLPAGMYLDSSEMRLVTFYSGTRNLTVNGEQFSSNQEVQEFMESHTSYEIKYNWNNTGRTWIHVYSDFTDVDLQFSDKSIETNPYSARFKVFIPYESIPEYGLNYKNYAYINLEPGGVEKTDDKWNPAYHYSINRYYGDTGYFDKDAADINENGSTTDLLQYGSSTVTLLEAYASQGALTKYVRSYKMENNKKVYNGEWDDSAITEPNGYYEYKNRFYNSTESSIKNLVIYDNLESYYYDTENKVFIPVTEENKWQGTFNGVDTSYLESKGYTVRTYYSTNEQAGSLKSGVMINDEWKLLTSLDTVNYPKVRSLAFEILDSQGESAVIIPDTTLYVTIQMRAPSNVSAPKAYNGFWIEWNAIDTNGQVLNYVDGIYGNIVNVRMNTTDVKINKVDEDGNPVSGAQLQILDENNQVVYSFTSGDEPTLIEEKLLDGKEYTLHEVNAPNGYIKADDVTFTADSTQTNQTITMTDKKIKVNALKVDEDDNPLAGALLQVKDGDLVIDEWTSTSQAHSINGNLQPGKTYKLHEETAPGGYDKSQDIEFTVNSNGETQTIKMTDTQTKINILKTDENDNPLAGAVLQVKDGNTVIDQWTSTREAHVISGTLTSGKTYTLEEVTPPDGYAKAVSKQFTVPTDGSGIRVTMSDTKTQLEVTKVDENNKNISGVVLQILDANNNSVVQEWTTTKNAKTIEGLIAGHNYILHEVSSPDGYLLSDDIPFTMNTDIGVQKIKMTDNATKVYITKVNSNGEELEGAKLQILSGNNVIDEWTTTKESTHEITGILGAGKTYKLHEVTPPNGYVVTNDKEFTVPNNNQELEVEMIDDPTNVSLIKLDSKTNEPLAGALLQVLDKDKNVVYEYTSTEEKELVTGLLVSGEKYYLHEAKAPDTYQRSKDVEFIVGDTSEELEVQMSDEKTQLKIEKVDEKGKTLAGATLQIIDREGNVIKEFESTEKAEELYGILNELEIYTLHEEKVPTGYLKAEDIKFKIDEQGRVNIFESNEAKVLEENTIKMVDKKPTNNIIINPETSLKKLYLLLIIVIIIPAIRLIRKKISI